MKLKVLATIYFEPDAEMSEEGALDQLQETLEENLAGTGVSYELHVINKDYDKNATALLLSAVDEALGTYGRDAISVDLNDITGMFDINQCHGSWSGVVSKDVVNFDDVDVPALAAALDERGVGYCF